MCAIFGQPLRSVVFLPLFHFLSSGSPFLLAVRLDLFCYEPGVYGKGFPIVACFPVVFQSSLCPREGGVRILRVRLCGRFHTRRTRDDGFFSGASSLV